MMRPSSLAPAADARAVAPEDPVPADAFRAAAGQFATGVTVVAAEAEGVTIAKTVSAFSSLSLDPPLIGAAIGDGSPLVRTLRHAERFGVSVLRADQSPVSDHFATAAHRRTEPPPVGFVAAGEHHGPVLDDCLSWFGCAVVDLLPAGDHVIVVGRVLAVRPEVSGTPLVHHAGRYAGVSSVRPPTQESP